MVMRRPRQTRPIARAKRRERGAGATRPRCQRGGRGGGGGSLPRSDDGHSITKLVLELLVHGRVIRKNKFSAASAAAIIPTTRPCRHSKETAPQADICC